MFTSMFRLVVKAKSQTAFKVIFTVVRYLDTKFILSFDLYKAHIEFIYPHKGTIELTAVNLLKGSPKCSKDFTPNSRGRATIHRTHWLCITQKMRH